MFLCLMAGYSDQIIFSHVFSPICPQHFLKNLKTYWSMAAGLVSLHSERIVLLTGTPFNNSCQDLATLMTYIKPSNKAAELNWWKGVTSPRVGVKVVERLAKWTSTFVLRREKSVIEHLLPKKEVRRENISETDLMK